MACGGVLATPIRHAPALPVFPRTVEVALLRKIAEAILRGKDAGPARKVAHRSVGRVMPELPDHCLSTILEKMLREPAGRAHGIELRWQPSIMNLDVRSEGQTETNPNLKIHMHIAGPAFRSSTDDTHVVTEKQNALRCEGRGTSEVAYGQGSGFGLSQGL